VNVATPAEARPAVKGRDREYETIYILRPDVDAESAERIQARVADAISREHGTLVKVEAWGRRRLAYPLGNQRRGVYVYVKYVGGGGLVAEVERNLKLQESVVKFMTMLVSDEVDVSLLQVDPEETKLGKLDLPPEEETEDSREKELGLVDLPIEAARSMRSSDDVDDFEAEDAGGEDGGPDRPGATRGGVGGGPEQEI
jgi:small subunit ribosomal protein S6